MDNMNKQKPIATDISQWNNCTEIIYKRPRCGQEFRTLGSYELFCHHCGLEIDWNVATHLKESYTDFDNSKRMKTLLNYINVQNQLGMYKLRFSEV